MRCVQPPRLWAPLPASLSQGARMGAQTRDWAGTTATICCMDFLGGNSVHSNHSAPEVLTLPCPGEPRPCPEEPLPSGLYGSGLPEILEVTWAACPCRAPTPTSQPFPWAVVTQRDSRKPHTFT